jgi:hypothetical protein
LSEEQAWESVKVFVNKMILFGAEPGIANRWWSSTEPLSSIVSAMHGYEGTLAKMAFQDKSTISLDSSDIAAVVDDWCELLGLPKGIREDIQIRYGAALERQYGSVVAPTVALFGFLLLIGLPALYAINKERNKKH